MTLQDAKKLYNLENPELKEIALRYFSENELSSGQLPVCWEDLSVVGGYYISSGSSICAFVSDVTTDSERNIFATTDQAKSALAFAQLSQLAKRMNDGWEPDWEDGTNKHSVLVADDGSLYSNFDFFTRRHIVFRTSELAKFSRENHAELWKQYWMV